eukprot:11206004-Lingulodinium_polyedra.AAC.1
MEPVEIPALGLVQPLRPIREASGEVAFDRPNGRAHEHRFPRMSGQTVPASLPVHHAKILRPHATRVEFVG